MPTDHTRTKLIAGSCAATALGLFASSCPSISAALLLSPLLLAGVLLLLLAPPGYWTALVQLVSSKYSFFARVLGWGLVTLVAVAIQFTPGDRTAKAYWLYCVGGGCLLLIVLVMAMITWIHYQVDKKYDKSLR